MRNECLGHERKQHRSHPIETESLSKFIANDEGHPRRHLGGRSRRSEIRLSHEKQNTANLVPRQSRSGGEEERSVGQEAGRARRKKDRVVLTGLHRVAVLPSPRLCWHEDSCFDYRCVGECCVHGWLFRHPPRSSATSPCLYLLKVLPQAFDAWRSVPSRQSETVSGNLCAQRRETSCHPKTERRGTPPVYPRGNDSSLRCFKKLHPKMISPTGL